MEDTKEELKFQLARINSYITNCKYDLNGMFPDSSTIKNKLEKLQEQKIAIERKLEVLKDEET